MESHNKLSKQIHPSQAGLPRRFSPTRTRFCPALAIASAPREVATSTAANTASTTTEP
jgi:hypothetical protein